MIIIFILVSYINDVEFDCVDYTNTNHPGPESNKLYAEKLKKIIDERYEANKISKTM